MAKIIAIVNQKGGVGKTTTAVNLTAALGAKGKRVLLVDIDPQGNSTSGLGINKRDVKFSSYDNIIGGTPASQSIVHSPFKNVDVIPMTSVHASVLGVKRYFDMTGNNVNHAGDFLVRIYAQTILETIVG